MADKPKEPKRVGTTAMYPVGDNDESPLGQSLAEVEKCTTQLGNLVVAWTALEGSVDRLIRSILAIKDDAVAETLLHNITARDKIKIAEGLGYLKQLSPDWFEMLKWCLDHTDGELRMRRNRLVHDQWHVGPAGVHRIHAKTGLRKEKGQKERVYYTKNLEPITSKMIEELTREIQRMIMRFDLLWRAGAYRERDWKEKIAEHAPLPGRPKGA